MILFYFFKEELILTALRLFQTIFNFENLSININHERLEGSYKLTG